MLKSSNKAFTDGLTLVTSTEVTGLMFSVTFAFGVGELDPGNNFWSFAKMPFLCLGDGLRVSLDSCAEVPSWLE